MGLPMYKPKDEEVAWEKHQAKDMMEDDYRLIFPYRWSNNRRSLSNNNNRNDAASNVQPRVSRIARRRSMLATSLLDRRRDSRVHQLPGSVTTVPVSSSPSLNASSSSSSVAAPSTTTASSSWSSLTSSVSTSPLVRSELDRRLYQRITEKEDLLEQLQVTVSLLDQFLSARAALGRDMILPSFITEDLPAVLEYASSLAAMSPSLLTSSYSTVTDVAANNEATTLQEMVDRLLQIPPYSIRIQYIQQNIISAHRRIREQLSVLGSSSVGLPHNAVTPTERIINNRRPVAAIVGGGTQPTAATGRRALPPRRRIDDENHTRSNFMSGSQSHLL